MIYFVILNIMITAIYTSCITIAAILFDKPGVLFWLLLLPFLFLIPKKPEKKNPDEEKDSEEV